MITEHVIATCDFNQDFAPLQGKTIFFLSNADKKLIFVKWVKKQVLLAIANEYS